MEACLEGVCLVLLGKGGPALCSSAAAMHASQTASTHREHPRKRRYDTSAQQVFIL